MRPCELSYPTMLTEMSKCLQAFDTTGNAQLTFCDLTALITEGMEMANEIFSIHGERRLQEPTEADQEAMRSKLWFERIEGFPPTAPRSTTFLQDLKTTWNLTKQFSQA